MTEKRKDYGSMALVKHREWQGKIEILARPPLDSEEDLSLAYTPGVAEPCLQIQKNPEESYALTRRHNLCLVVTDGSAVLGLGDIGPEAAMPVMEGKCALFKHFGDVDAFPLCIQSHDVDTIVETIYQISGSFGGINLEDISAPRCFAIEEKLIEKCDIPVFHDDQHGTAVVTLAGIINALRLVDKKLEDVKIVINGAGSAAIAIAKILYEAGAGKLLICDSRGIIYPERTEGMNSYKEDIARRSSLKASAGKLADAVVGADIFIGVSVANALSTEMVSTMNDNSIVFACANPVPEIYPDEAKAGGCMVMATGRSDYPNQINNVLAFPAIFRGAFDVRASEINAQMKIAAAHALADLVPADKLSPDYIIPSAFDPNLKTSVADAVAKAAIDSGVARIK